MTMPESFPVDRYLVPDRVFDGTVVHENHAVGITGDRVTAMVPTSELPGDAERRRLAGVTLSPGLIDAHIHLAPWMMFGLIAAGVTTVRDVGNDIDIAPQMIDAMTDVPRPDIMWSGPLLESDRVNWPTIGRAHDSADAIRRTVDDLASRGLTTIKLYANSTRELVIAATEQAHRHGMRVLHHLGVSTLADARDAGVDELQHLAGCLAADLGAPSWAEAAEMLAAIPIDHCPTFVVWDALAHLGNPRLDRDVATSWVPPVTRRGWANAHHASQPASDRIRRVEQLIERMAAIPVLRAAGRTILVGSDSPFPGLIPGFALHDEAGFLVESGMAPLDVMQCLTSVNAAAIGATGAGSISAGAPADLVAFSGDPTRRIADLSSVAAVWRLGREVDLGGLLRAATSFFETDLISPMDLLAESRYITAAARTQ
jgi:imidazolonepropionase-like amidohydrolase